MRKGKEAYPIPAWRMALSPPLNQIDPTLASRDYKQFAAKIDLFIYPGSAPEGKNPERKMPAEGDQKMLTQQQSADVIAYIISLNKK